MGKTPGKWIKNFLLGKKSSKSSPSKGREVLKSSNKVEQAVSSAKFSVSDPTISSPLVCDVACNKKGVENLVPSVSNSIGKEQGSSSTQTVVCSATSEETERLKLEQSATKAQAAFRGYAARREIRSQKSITILQAHIRGHLVRRQAVSTLCCVKEIVKFQTLVRGEKATVNLNSLGGTKLARPSKNAFIYKLRASLRTVIPLQLQYGSEEPNSASLWLERWTKSRFWDGPSEPKKTPDLKPHKKNDAARTTDVELDKPPKRSSRRLSSGSNAENGSMASAQDSEKGKRNPKKVSGNTANTLQEHSPNDIDKVKRGGTRKAVSDRSPVENGKPRRRTKPVADILDLTVDDSAEQSYPVDKFESQSPLDFQPTEDRDFEQKHSERRASLPAKFEPPQENVVAQNSPKLPSYMAPTESVKAKLRSQGSPRFSPDMTEKNMLMRRHSLSSSTNSMLSNLSPRAHKLSRSAGKGPIRGDRSLSSSRDAGADKLSQAEWRR